MSKADSPDIEMLKIKLTKLVDCILNKASSDSEFANQIKEVLLEDSDCKITRKRKTKSTKFTFNAVEYLQQHNKDKLRDELNTKTGADLSKILRDMSSMKPKDLKNIERQQLIEKIILEADRLLNQGSAFLQVKEPTPSLPNKSITAD